MPAVDPDGGDAKLLSGRVVVKEALRDMQQVTTVRAEGGEDRAEEPVEMRVVRLVGADILRGDDGVEGDPEPLGAGSDPCPVDI